jgi:hypothetical protein
MFPGFVTFDDIRTYFMHIGAKVDFLPKSVALVFNMISGFTGK